MSPLPAANHPVTDAKPDAIVDPTVGEASSPPDLVSPAVVDEGECGLGAAGLSGLAQSLAEDAAKHATSNAISNDVGALASMVQHPMYPCLGARSVFARGRAQVESLGELGTAESARRLLQLLTTFAEDLDVDAGFASLLAVFHSPRVKTEAEFERLLWRQLELVHEVDEQAWDPSVSSDPADPHFAFSVAGRAYFVVGLHPHASRIARRMPHPTLVFNVHEQFEHLRRSARFSRMRDTIRRRDVQLQGHLNPMVADHGRDSEARQYSGRAVPSNWEPPGELGFADNSRNAAGPGVGVEPEERG